MTFDEAKERTADDLRQIATMLNTHADNIMNGDIQVMDTLLNEKLPQWFDMLVIRYNYVQEQLNNSR